MVLYPIRFSLGKCLAHQCVCPLWYAILERCGDG